MTDAQNTVDQAAIDEILASAEADTPESRIDKLEKEVDVLKGSVKKLLLDLRETLNNIENPFQNLQNLAEGALGSATAQQPPQIQIIPTQIPEPATEPETEPEKEIGEETEGDEEEAEENVVVEEVEDKTSPHLEVMEEKAEGDIVQDYSLQVKTEPEPSKSEDKATSGIGVAEIKKYDIVMLFNLMDWVKGMLEKYNLDSLKLMLELFESAGYISEDAKDFVCKVAELVSLNDGFEDMLLELYRLHKLMNPADNSMDSKLLSLILEKRL